MGVVAMDMVWGWGAFTICVGGWVVVAMDERWWLLLLFVRDVGGLWVASVGGSVCCWWVVMMCCGHRLQVLVVGDGDGCLPPFVLPHCVLMFTVGGG